MVGYFNPIVSLLVDCLTCLAQHVGGDGEGGPDGGVEGKEDHPENHASPHRQVRELQKKKKKNAQRERTLRDWNKTRREVRNPDVRLIRICANLSPAPRACDLL